MVVVVVVVEWWVVIIEVASILALSAVRLAISKSEQFAIYAKYVFKQGSS